MKVLVVDDDEFFYQTIGDLIRHAGHEPVWARDGDECMATASIERPDVIFLDVMLPGETGYKTCQRLREHPHTKDIYIVMMSSRISDAAKATAIKRGADKFLAKPVDSTVVHEILDTMS